MCCLLVLSVEDVNLLLCGERYLGTGFGQDLLFVVLLCFVARPVISLGPHNILINVCLLLFVSVLLIPVEILSCPFGCSRTSFVIEKGDQYGPANNQPSRYSVISCCSFAASCCCRLCR